MPVPPLYWLQDSSCERLTELALNDAEVAGALLRQALQPCREAFTVSDAPAMREGAAAFQRVRASHAGQRTMVLITNPAGTCNPSLTCCRRMLRLSRSHSRTPRACCLPHPAPRTPHLQGLKAALDAAVTIKGGVGWGGWMGGRLAAAAAPLAPPFRWPALFSRQPPSPPCPAAIVNPSCSHAYPQVC